MREDTRATRGLGTKALRRPIKALVLYAFNRSRSTLSYQQGWPNAIASDARFDVTLANVMTRRGRLLMRAALASMRFDAIVILHSVLSNEGVIWGPVLDEIARHPAPKAYFIGNEYRFIPQKIEFCEQVDVSLLVTMLHSPRAHELYRERLGCEVVEIPSAGVDTSVFFPTTELIDRPLDLGMRAFDEPLFLGHQERRLMGSTFARYAAERGFTVDVSFDPADRFTPPGYAAFLNRCRGQLGTEAGSDFFELTDDLVNRVDSYMKENGGTDLDELRPIFFAEYPDPLPARTITGRHAEAAATKTVQILFEGEYSGFFEPDVHYLALAKDLSNADDVLDRFRDDTVCRAVAEKAYRVAVEELTYERLLDRFVAAMRPLLPRQPVRR